MSDLPAVAGGGNADPAMITNRQEFAAALTTVRERTGLTVREVGKAVGTPFSTIGGYFGGRHLPPVSQPDLIPEILRACGVTDERTIEGWVQALIRVRRAPGPRPASAPVPYRGLARFEEEHADWFFGRERLTDLLVGRLRERYAMGGLLAVVGPSGSGKSSLLRAGMIPALRRAALDIPGSRDWPIRVVTPGVKPLRTLAEVLADLTRGDVEHIEAILRATPHNIRTFLDQAIGFADRPSAGSKPTDLEVDNPDSGWRPVLVVDQFEEIFASGTFEGERRAFIDALACAGSRCTHSSEDLEACGDEHPDAPAALVVLGLRADFYDNALRDRSLTETLQHVQVIVPPMAEAELRQAIVEPARKAKVDLEDGLAELLLREMAPAADQDAAGAAHDVGALPLLSHALWSTWERGQRRQLTIADYRNIGGIRGAVALSAEEVYTALAPSHQALARQFFLRMVQVTEDAPDTRRRVPHQELPLHDSDAQEVLDRFIQRRLITAETSWIEITHEALIVAWPRLRGWIDGDRAGLRTHRQLTAAAESWRDSEHDPHLLYRAGRLALATEWAAEARPATDLNPLERRFLDASAKHELAEALAARRRTRTLQQLTAALTVLVVAAGLLAAYAFQQSNVADRERDLAVSRQIAITANQLRDTDPALARQLSLAAYQTATTPEARASLLDSFSGPAVTRVLGAPGVMQSIAFTADGRTMAAGGTDATVRLWTMANDRGPRRLGPALTGHKDTIYAVAFSPDGRTLASASGDRSVRLWNVTEPEHSSSHGTPQIVAEHTVYSVAFSPDGRTLAVGSADSQVRLWDITNPTRPVQLGRPLTGHTKAVQSVAFSPDGRTLASGSFDRTVRTWNVADINHPTSTGPPVTGPERAVFAVAFSPDGDTLAAGSADGTIWFWNLVVNPGATRVARRLTGPTSWVNSIAFSPSGRYLAAGSSDGKVWMWSLADGRVVASLPHPGPVTSVTFSRDDFAIGTGAADGIARIWQTPGPIITGPTDDIFSVTFANKKHTMAVTSTDNTAALWNVVDPRRPIMMGVPISDATRSGRASGAAALSPDGNTLAIGAVDGSIQLWNVTNPANPTPIPERLRGPTGNIEGVAFSPDGRTLAAGSDDKKIWLWNISDTNRPALLSQPLADHTNYAYGPTFTHDGHILVAGGADNTVRLWSVASPERPTVLGPPLTDHTNYVFATAFSPDGRILATGGADNTIRLWDLTNPSSPRLLGKPLTGPNNYVYSLAFDPRGQTLAAAGGDGRVWLWSLESISSPQLLASLAAYGGPVFVVAFDPQNGMLAAGGDQGTVRLWDVVPTRVSTHICATAGDIITRAEWTKYVPDVPYRAPC